MLGKTLSHYKILEKLGSGGMGDVYVAEDTTLGRKVALKVLPPETTDSPERRERFLKEARAVAALSHPNVLAIHDFGEEQGVPFAVMELLEGQTLRERLDEGSVPVIKAVEYARQIADGLEAGHTRGVVHRDLKPENLFITKPGKIKILDFGLAKRREEAGGEESPTQTRATEPGTVMGTVGYMSPEQVRGRSADHRSDVFSFGAVLYEMLSGQRAFRGESAAVTMSAILKEDPPDISTKHSNIPPSLERIVRRCLEKNPDERFQSAQDVSFAIDALSEERTTERPPVADEEPPSKKSRKWKIFLAFLIIFAPAVAAIWFLQGTSKVRWAREQAIPEIHQLVEEEEYWAALKLARQAEAYIPTDPTLASMVQEFTRERSIETTPPGADVYIRQYKTADDDWEYAGQTPTDPIRLPVTLFEIRMLKDGYTPVQKAGFPPRREEALHFTLDEAGSIPSEMVRAAGDAPLRLVGLEHLDPGPLEDYLIDQYEVTNKQFKEFVDGGGYQNREFWREEFVKGGCVLSWEEAMPMLTDATGRPGPSAWELGDYRDGEEDHPVTGVSWYEAAAYAEYAGKKLPTIFHWNKAAQPWHSEYIIPVSNFGRGPASVGSHRGMSASGAYDMAGNVREWCWNEDTRGWRFILGGGWDDAVYMFNDPIAQNPFDRSAINGFRCMRYLEAPGNLAELTQPVEIPYRDYLTEEPVSDEIFAVYNNLYKYDRTALNAEIESEDASAEDWVKQKIFFDAAYGGERMFAYLLLPRTGAPPYQVVVYFPGSNVIHTRSSESLRTREIDFILKSGRALMWPVYKSTYERGDALRSDISDESNFWKEHVIMWAKDLGRSIDYLETRDDIDSENMAYYGYSWGGAMGPIMMAVEERFKAGILFVGGFMFQRSQPEVDQINFVSRTTIPVLMLNGRYDYFFPLDTAQKPFFEGLGTPPEHKRMFVYEKGHYVPRTSLIKETLDWLDRYLGPVG